MKKENLTIFVVEDSEMALAAVTNELQKRINCKVRGFTSAEDCIHRMEDSLPDLIISDYYLSTAEHHRMNGDQLLARIKQKYTDIPVIMYSSKNSIDTVIHLMSLGAVDFIPKEKNFIARISDTALNTVKKIVYDNEMKSFTRGVMLFFSFIIVTLVAVYSYVPDLLPYFTIGIPVTLLLGLFFLSNGNAESRSS